ncbi:hypothetical protein J1614_011341 [Plenodomus biglobosus]|nr:hypothetical protein J1614_011341 [Plenodomus biglobosus]
MRFTIPALITLAIGLSSASPVASNDNEARQVGCVVGLVPTLLLCASAIGICLPTTVDQICACKTELLTAVGQEELDAVINAIGNLCPAV